MNTRPDFHGSDIEKVCEYYGLNKDTIINFGANVNPLGLSRHVKETLANHLDLLSSYPDRDYQALRSVLFLHTVRFPLILSYPAMVPAN